MNGHLNPCIVFKKCKPSFQQISLHGKNISYGTISGIHTDLWPFGHRLIQLIQVLSLEWNGIQKTIGKPDQVIACFCFYLPLWHHLCEWTPISTCSMYPMKLERDLIGANPSVVLGFLLFTFTHTPSVELCLFSSSM